MKGSSRAAAVTVFAVGLLVPVSAWAQVVPSPPWGEPIQDASLRFVVLASYNNQAVYDNETGLVWEQSPVGTANWQNAQFACNTKAVGNRKGWRLPTIQELASLIDPSVPSPGPTLPANHPFIGVQSSFYWSATTNASESIFVWVVDFGFGLVTSSSRPVTDFVWCVRGGQGPDAQ